MDGAANSPSWGRRGTLESRTRAGAGVGRRLVTTTLPQRWKDVCRTSYRAEVAADFLARRRRHRVPRRPGIAATFDRRMRAAARRADRRRRAASPCLLPLRWRALARTVRLTARRSRSRGRHAGLRLQTSTVRPGTPRGASRHRASSCWRPGGRRPQRASKLAFAWTPRSRCRGGSSRTTSPSRWGRRRRITADDLRHGVPAGPRGPPPRTQRCTCRPRTPWRRRRRPSAR